MSYQPIRGRGLGSARNGMPAAKPYVYRGDPDPVIGTPQTRLAARIAAQAIWDTAGPGPDDPGYEWHRELATELEDAPAHVIPLPRPEPAPPPVAGPPAARCPVCRYLTGSIGHRVNCGG